MQSLMNISTFLDFYIEISAKTVKYYIKNANFIFTEFEMFWATARNEVL